MNTSHTKMVFNHGKPKVNLSAYNIFFLTERKRILCGMDEATSRASPFTKEEVLRAVLECKLRRGKRPHRKSHGLISFKNLTNTIGGRWKRLDPESERVVRNQAVIEKRIYMEQKELWRSLSKQGIQPLEFNNNTNQGGEVDDGFPSALGAGGAVTPPFVVVNQSLTPQPVGSGAIISADANDNNKHDILSAMKMSIFDDSQWFNEMEDTMAMEPIDPQDMDSIFD